MYKAGGVLGLLSLIMQLLLNRCSRLVWNLGVEAVAGVPQLLFRVTAVGGKWQFESPRKCRDSPKSDGDRELNLNSTVPCPRISVAAQFWNPFLYFFIVFHVFSVVVSVLQKGHERYSDTGTAQFSVCVWFRSWDCSASLSSDTAQCARSFFLRDNGFHENNWPCFDYKQRIFPACILLPALHPYAFQFRWSAVCFQS